MRHRDEAKFRALAQTIALGSETIRDWCQANNVKETTAYQWSRTTEFRQQVTEIRQAAFDSGLGRMTALLDEAVEKLATLIKDGERKHIVQLQAARGLIADLATLRESVGRDRELAEIRAEIEELKKGQKVDEGPPDASSS